MADGILNANANTVELYSDKGQLARERLLWALKPFCGLALFLWVISPDVAAVPPEVLADRAILGFLFGSGFALLLFWRKLHRFLMFQLDAGRNQHNRLPDEFYVGTIDTVMAEWKR